MFNDLETVRYLVGDIKREVKEEREVTKTLNDSRSLKSGDKLSIVPIDKPILFKHEVVSVGYSPISRRFKKVIKYNPHKLHDKRVLVSSRGV